MDPKMQGYIATVAHDQETKMSTPVYEGAGANPKWLNTFFTLNVGHTGESILFQVSDYSRVQGSVKLKVSELMKGLAVDKWFKLQDRMRQNVGFLHVKTEFAPAGSVESARLEEAARIEAKFLDAHIKAFVGKKRDRV